jgi:maltooligosyltrehalose trehalohydrolase
VQPGISRTDENHWRFTVWAPFADRVELIFPDVSEWFDMEKGKGGYWTKTIASVASDTAYWYRLNGDIQRADPASACQPNGVNGPSRVVDHRSFSWADSGCQQVALEDYIIYEVHIGTFTPEGTFTAAAERLPYLKEMGITAVEVMPVAQFPGRRNWGYDGVFPYAVQNSYGGPDAFKNFINTAHRLGLAVILDVVYNHLGPEGNFLRDFGPYFTDHYNTPWGEAVNFDQAYSDEVRNFFIENALYWFCEYHLDALRLDALHAVFDMSAKHFIREMSERVKELSKQLNRPLYLIGETDWMHSGLMIFITASMHC